MPETTVRLLPYAGGQHHIGKIAFYRPDTQLCRYGQPARFIAGTGHGLSQAGIGKWRCTRIHSEKRHADPIPGSRVLAVVQMEVNGQKQTQPVFWQRWKKHFQTHDSESVGQVKCNSANLILQTLYKKVGLNRPLTYHIAAIHQT